MNDLTPIKTAPPALRRGAPDLPRLASEVLARAMSPKGSPTVPSAWEVMRRRLPFLSLFDRLLFRALMLIARRHVVCITGMEHVLAPHPFILALNHSTRREALIVPAALIFNRGGRLIHFWSDWMFRLVPVLALILRRSDTIVVTTKRSQLPLVNLFRPLFAQRQPAIEQARAHLKANRPIGVFPEGTVNRNPHRLLPGRYGAARLSLEMGVPVVPAGIVFPPPAPGARTALEIRIGAPLMPPACAGARPTFAEVRAWHATVMSEIARLCGKTWDWHHIGSTIEEAEPAAEAA